MIHVLSEAFLTLSNNELPEREQLSFRNLLLIGSGDPDVNSYLH